MTPTTVGEALSKMRRELEVTSYHVGKDRLFELLEQAEALAAADAPAPSDTRDSEAEQRLGQMLIEALGPRHAALDDLARLIFARNERDKLKALLAAAQPAEQAPTGEQIIGALRKAIHSAGHGEVAAPIVGYFCNEYNALLANAGQQARGE